MMLAVDCGNPREAVKAVEILCRETGFFCYEPKDLSEALVSLSWAETLQFVDPECSSDVVCASNALNSFAEALGLAMGCRYVFGIDVDRVRDRLRSLSSRVALEA